MNNKPIKKKEEENILLWFGKTIFTSNKPKSIILSL